ncbi:MAG: cytochrome P450 [Actinobacteria bacterium]|nr:cytochrome P450 [Actinomycetota bacterium]
MRDEEPVWFDKATGMYNITRYDDIRAILLDTERFSNAVGQGANNSGKALKPADPEEARKQAEIAELAQQMTALYEEKGWVPAPSLDARDDPNHIQLRRLFDFAFRPAAIRDIDPFVEELAYGLFDNFIDRGECEWVADYAVPLPLYIIGRQMGVPDDDLPQIKIWTDAWIKRMGLMQTPEEMRWSVEMEIEGQHYFQKRFEKLRKQPDESLLSILVNREIPEWGRPMTDNELHAEMFADTFVGGSETTTNALAEGIVMLVNNPNVWDKLKSDPVRFIEPFCEEVLRLESPVQGLMRNTTCDVELHGVTIPEGAVVMLRFASGNRDERFYGEAVEEIDLERKHPRRHLAFGVGSHHCLGAPLARRELYYGFKALVDRVEEVWFLDGKNDFHHHQNFFMRALQEVQVGFKPIASWEKSVALRSEDTRE